MKALQTVAGMKAEHEAKVLAFDALAQDIQTDIKESEDIGYQKALNDQNVPPTDKIYTEADLQAEKLISYNQGKAEAELAAQGAIAEAVALKQAEMLADYKSTKLDDQAFEAKYSV